MEFAFLLYIVTIVIINIVLYHGVKILRDHYNDKKTELKIWHKMNKLSEIAIFNMIFILVLLIESYNKKILTEQHIIIVDRLPIIVSCFYIIPIILLKISWFGDGAYRIKQKYKNKN